MLSELGLDTSSPGLERLVLVSQLLSGSRVFVLGCTTLQGGSTYSFHKGNPSLSGQVTFGHEKNLEIDVHCSHLFLLVPESV
jgi:hypothetical protein